MCRCCQSCLESLYWNCCEERFCWDDSIAEYDEWDDDKCYSNHTVSVDSLEPITAQPVNNNHLHLDENRLVLGELPIHALDIYKVFSKSMIFKDDGKYVHEEEKPKTPVGRVVSFEDEQDDEQDQGKMSDFQIMFQDELYKDHTMFKIEEEEEDEGTSPTDDGLVMKSSEAPEFVVTPVTPPSVEEKTISRVDSSKSITKETMTKPKGILLPRTDSVKSFTRKDALIRRGDSMNLDTQTLKTVLARLPQKSASFLSIQDLLDENKKDVFTISNPTIGQMPDTPVIKGGKLPKFFAETPVIGEYKAETSLRNIVQSPGVIFTESDYSMPRYYGRAKTIANINVQETLNSSKSLPDLNAARGETVSKRLSRLGSRLKPLIIKKHDHELNAHSLHI